MSHAYHLDSDFNRDEGLGEQVCIPRLLHLKFVYTDPGITWKMII